MEDLYYPSGIQAAGSAVLPPDAPGAVAAAATSNSRTATAWVSGATAYVRLWSVDGAALCDPVPVGGLPANTTAEALALVATAPNSLFLVCKLLQTSGGRAVVYARIALAASALTALTSLETLVPAHNATLASSGVAADAAGLTHSVQAGGMAVAAAPIASAEQSPRVLVALPTAMASGSAPAVPAVLLVAARAATGNPDYIAAFPATASPTSLSMATSHAAGATALAWTHAAGVESVFFSTAAETGITRPLAPPAGMPAVPTPAASVYLTSGAYVCSPYTATALPAPLGVAVACYGGEVLANAPAAGTAAATLPTFAFAGVSATKALLRTAASASVDALSSFVASAAPQAFVSGDFGGGSADVLGAGGVALTSAAALVLFTTRTQGALDTVVALPLSYNDGKALGAAYPSGASVAGAAFASLGATLASALPPTFPTDDLGRQAAPSGGFVQTYAVQTSVSADWAVKAAFFPSQAAWPPSSTPHAPRGQTWPASCRGAAARTTWTVDNGTPHDAYVAVFSPAVDDTTGGVPHATTFPPRGSGGVQTANDKDYPQLAVSTGHAKVRDTDIQVGRGANGVVHTIDPLALVANSGSAQTTSIVLYWDDASCSARQAGTQAAAKGGTTGLHVTPERGGHGAARLVSVEEAKPVAQAQPGWVVFLFVALGLLLLGAAAAFAHAMRRYYTSPGHKWARMLAKNPSAAKEAARRTALLEAGWAE